VARILYFGAVLELLRRSPKAAESTKRNLASLSGFQKTFSKTAHKG
jgi:hypothetical protein